MILIHLIHFMDFNYNLDILTFDFLAIVFAFEFVEFLLLLLFMMIMEVMLFYYLIWKVIIILVIVLDYD